MGFEIARDDLADVAVVEVQTAGIRQLLESIRPFPPASHRL
ncbi:MAG: hypothetical protein R2849_09460 [Thermomicrobiales bacterium]